MSEHLRQPVVASVDEYDGSIVVRLAGEIDLYNVEEIRQALDEVSARSPERLVVQLADVTFIDSTGLGALIEARRKLPNRRAFLLSEPRREVLRALEITGLAKHMRICDTLEEALSARL